jgi:carboxylesterase type B
LKAATQQTYIDGYNPQLYGFGDFYYGPSVDGDIIRDLPSNEWKQGHFTKTPLLVDRNGYEGYGFSNQSELTAAGTQMDLQELFPYAKQSFFDRLYQLYPADAFNSTFWQRQTLFSDFIITCPTYYMASAMSDMGVPTYKLIFNAGTQLHGATGVFIALSNDSPRKFTWHTLLIPNNEISPLTIFIQRYQQRHHSRVHERLVHLVRHRHGPQRQHLPRTR